MSQKQEKQKEKIKKEELFSFLNNPNPDVKTPIDKLPIFEAALEQYK